MKHLLSPILIKTIWQISQCEGSRRKLIFFRDIHITNVKALHFHFHETIAKIGQKVHLEQLNKGYGHFIWAAGSI